MNDSTTHFISAQRDILVLGRFFNGDNAKNDVDRSAISMFSERSRRRLRSYLRNSFVEYKCFITLTYPPGYGVDGDICKHELKNFLERLKRLQTRRNDRRVGNDGKQWSIMWFQEWQRNGRLHFHLCATHDFPKEWLSQAWYDIVGSDNPNHLKAGTQIKRLKGGRAAMGKYASKYCSKAEQKEVPEDFGWVGRFWGVWGNKTTVAAAISYNRRTLEDQDKFSIIKALRVMIKELIDEQKLVLIIEKGNKNEFRVYKYASDNEGKHIRAYVSLVSSQLLLTKPHTPDVFDINNDLNRYKSDPMTTEEAIRDYSDLNNEVEIDGYCMHRATESERKAAI